VNFSRSSGGKVVSNRKAIPHRIISVNVVEGNVLFGTVSLRGNIGFAFYGIKASS